MEDKKIILDGFTLTLSVSTGPTSPVERMTPSERDFYAAWLKAWKSGVALPINGEISYLFCYMTDIPTWHPDAIIDELDQLRRAYPTEKEPFGSYCQRWTSDAYMVLGRYGEALAAHPEPALDGRSAASTDRILSIQLQLNGSVRGRDIVTLNGPQTTQWGRDHLKDISDFIEATVRAKERDEGINLLAEWARPSHRFGYYVFPGVHTRPLDVPCYSFSANQTVIEFVRAVTREAENTAREEMGIPRVGEGWIGETELYYKLRDALPQHAIQQHARPDWLGRQHLDVFFPGIKVAIEYHGLQHDEPIAFFGGIKAFEECVRRDERKKRLCGENSVRLLYVREGYDLNDLIAAVLKADV